MRACVYAVAYLPKCFFLKYTAHKSCSHKKNRKGRGNKGGEVGRYRLQENEKTLEMNTKRKRDREKERERERERDRERERETETETETERQRMRCWEREMVIAKVIQIIVNPDKERSSCCYFPGMLTV